MEKHDTAKALAEKLALLCEGQPPAVVMEVCGTHTQSAARCNLRALLPANMRLISGPGCPVCVTGGGTIAKAIALARRPHTCVCTFGDMLRVPVRLALPDGGCCESSLLRERGLGRDVRMALSPLEALAAAEAEPDKDFVWFGVGFETSAPHTAALVQKAKARGVRNLTVLCAHKTMPAALCALLGAGESPVTALLCPGHVAAVTGAEAFRFVPEKLGLPAAVAGFAPEEMLSALTALAEMLRSGTPGLRNMYPAAVRAQGNPAALALMNEVFEPCAAVWRGLGEIAGSGLRLRDACAAFDAERRFCPAGAAAPDDEKGCRCGEILRGAAAPRSCPLFGTACTPDSPRGPCMVSSEGACAAEYRYGAK